MIPGPGEPAVTSWRVESLDAVARLLLGAAPPDGRPRIIAVDGRGGGGKTTLAERLRAAVPGAAVVHTDDVAWWHSRFGWAEPMTDGILGPLRAGRDVRFQPPGWAGRGRTGFVEVSAAAPAVIVEGVGASRRELAGLIDVAVWTQSDFADAKRRGLRRDIAERGLDDATAEREWDEWMVEEVPFLLADRPWERADLIVAGAPVLPHDPEAEVLVGRIQKE